MKPRCSVLTTGRLDIDHVAALEALQGPVTIDRRCEAPAELLATARHTQADAALLIGQPEIITGSFVEQLRGCGLRVVVITDLLAERERLRLLGVRSLPDDVPAETLAQALQEEGRTQAEHTSGGEVLRSAAPGAVEGWGLSSASGDPMPKLPPPPRSRGSQEIPKDTGAVPRGITAVWGPHGAPGRTTTAISIASELAIAGAQVLLVDADSWSASAAAHLGLLEESAGLAQACRAADRGTLDGPGLVRLAQTVRTAGSSWDVLTGLPRPERWAELRPRAVERVLHLAAARYSHVIIDVAAPLEHNEEISFGTSAPQRNSAAVSSLSAADQVILVGAPDPVGFSRLVRSLGDYAEAVPDGVAPKVVINQLRGEVVGRSPQRRIAEAWARYGGGQVGAPAIEAYLPYDRSACDTALRHGQVLAECAEHSELRRAFAALVGVTVPRRRRWGLKK